SRTSPSAAPASSARTQNTMSSPRCSVPAAAAATSDAISAATSSASAAPAGTTTSTHAASPASLVASPVIVLVERQPSTNGSAGSRRHHAALHLATQALARLAGLALALDARLLVEAATL